MREIWKTMGAGKRALWIALAAVMAAMYFIYCYTDILLIIRHSFGIYDTIRLKMPLSFYSYGTGRALGDTMELYGEVPYDIWVYLPIALWNLPTYIWECVTGATFESHLLAVWWGKAMFFLPLIGSCAAVAAIAGIFEKRYREAGVFLFLSSSFLMYGLGCLNQVDICCVCFILWGIYAALTENRRMFYVWFALAVTFKMFGLFVAIPLILYREKRVLFIVRDMLFVCSLTLISKLLFYADKMKCPTKFDEIRFSYFFAAAGSSVGLGVMYLFPAVFLAILFAAYCKGYDRGDDRREEFIVWISFAALGSFFLLSNSQPYWMVLLSPFVGILAAAMPGKAKALVYADTAASLLMVLVRMLKGPLFVAGYMNLQYGIFRGILKGNPETKLVSDFVKDHVMDFDFVLGVLLSLFVAALACEVVYACPRLGKREEEKPEKLVDTSVLWFRLLAGGAVCLLPVLMIGIE